jgi:hypothetical protein
VACREEVSKGVWLLRSAVIAASRGQGEGLVSLWLSARAVDAMLLKFEVSVVASGCVCVQPRENPERSRRRSHQMVQLEWVVL